MKIIENVAVKALIKQNKKFRNQIENFEKIISNMGT